MKKIWLIFKAEFINTFTRKSFLLTLILVPLVPALILGAISLFSGGESETEAPGLFQPPQESPLPDGYVDQAGIISNLPAWVDSSMLVPFDTADDAKNAVQSGEISGYYLIPLDYLETGSISYVTGDYRPFSDLEKSGMIDVIIRYNLLGADMRLFEAYNSPLRVEQVNLAPDEVVRDQSHPLAFYLPYGVTMLFYILIMTSASLMMNSVAKEKENRVMEIMMSSVDPKQMLAGKILGLGLVGLIQMVLWTGSALLMLNLGSNTLNIPASLLLQSGFLFWGIIFFVLGYLIYASLMAGVGALVPNVKEASQATFYIIIPILIPLLMISMIIETPHAPLPVILSLIPLTAPNTIMTRLAVGAVPLWQLLTAVVLMVLTIILLIRGVAGMFRAQILLTGQKFSLGLFIKALLGIETGPQRS